MAQNIMKYICMETQQLKIRRFLSTSRFWVLYKLFYHLKDENKNIFSVCLMGKMR